MHAADNPDCGKEGIYITHVMASSLHRKPTLGFTLGLFYCNVTPSIFDVIVKADSSTTYKKEENTLCHMLALTVIL